MRTSGVAGALLVTVGAFAGFGACGGDDDNASSDDAGVPEGPPQRAEFGLDTRPANMTCKAPPRPPNPGPVKFEQVYNALPLNMPMVMAQRPGDGSRWYVAHRGGGITHFPSANPTALS